MPAMSNYLIGKLLNHVFRSTAFTQPTTIAVALCTAETTSSQTGATIPEVTGGGYARVDIGRLDAQWSRISNSVRNAFAVTFPTATGNWGTITHMALLDSATIGSGNVLFHGPLLDPKTIITGDIFVFNSIQLAVQIK